MGDAPVKFEDFLQSSNVIILDGAIGTELDKRELAGRCESNLINPDIVVNIHRDYVKAGSNVIITNTLTMNRIYIESHKIDIDVAKVNKAGVELAKKAMRENGYVLGNLGSTGQMLEPYGTYSEASVIDNFKEQANYLGEGGVDGFIIETMFDLREAVCALQACKAVSSLPVVVCIAYYTERNGGRTIMGNSADECARVLSDEGASALGANCGSIDPAQMAEIVTALSSSTDLPLVAEPNAGKPRLVNGHTVFDMDEKTFASELLRCLHAGASVLGGCCGTSPGHIRACTERLRKEVRQ